MITKNFHICPLKSDLLNKEQVEKITHCIEINDEWIIHQSKRYLRYKKWVHL